MAFITFLKGDATQPDVVGPKIVAHICNDIGGWGKGFVLALSRRWNEPETNYRQWYAARDANDFSLGSVQFVPVDKDLWAIVYDLYRLPFVLSGVPLFKAFPKFGELLLGGTEPRWLVHALGWTYHFSNGAALGIMFLSMVSCFRRPILFWRAVMWAMFVEMMLLLTPYAAFFGLTVNGQFLFLTASAHLVFGITLGYYCQQRLTIKPS